MYLIRAYLKDASHQIDVAENGAIALEKFKSGEYDLILMDVQMPVMDGLTATRKIGELELARGAEPVPIFALTAHALKEQIDRSLNAGCTAHLSKPVRHQALLEAIQTFAGQRSSPPAEIQVRVDRRLRDLVPWFIERRREDVPVLLDALERGDFPGIRTLGHNMKGTGTGYGLARITDIGAAIESAAQEENRTEIRRRVTDLTEYLDRVSIIYE